MVETLHIEEHLRRDTESLRKKLRRMADYVIEGLEGSVTALAGRDRKLAYAVVLADNRIDVLEGHIDRLCQEFMVRHMPVAAQLRFVVALAKVNSELERMGDYAEAIARRAVRLSATTGEAPAMERLVAMSKISFQMLRHAVDAFLHGDIDLAHATLELDKQVNAHNRAIWEELSHPPEGERDLMPRFILLGVSFRLERVADRACNIAEEAIYVARGQVLRHVPHHDLRVLFLCDHNACRSQMAEAIARRRAPAHFVLASAGTEPTTLDPRAVEFMAKQGTDIARQRPKGLGEVGNFDDYNVVVTLTHQAEEKCPPVPYKTVALNWEVYDPSKATGAPEEIEAAYRRAFDELDSKIHELIESLLGHADREEEE